MHCGLGRDAGRRPCHASVCGAFGGGRGVAAPSCGGHAPAVRVSFTNRRLGMKFRTALFAFLLSLVVAMSAPPASADWSTVTASPMTLVCYEKVDAYGGLYLMRNAIANNTGLTQTMRTEVYGPNGLNFAADTVAAPGALLGGQAPYVSIYWNDMFHMRLNGAQILQVYAGDTPWYLNHCLVRYTGNWTIDRALRFGLSQLDGPYVGGASPYRFGAPGNGGTYQQLDKYGNPLQKKYLSPLGARGYDCSGLVTAMYRNAGLYFPDAWTSSAAMYGAPFVSITAAQLRPGDLIVKPNAHVAIYLGDGNGDGVASVLEATPSSPNVPEGQVFVKGVVISPATKYLTASGAPIAGNGYVLRRVPGV
ncbi:MAG: hypothetical protein E6Q88_11420 [Lysobacteraceae bacterium]|nr:MAG: hypothetical protein E6Q88_11420 [Xanthomonadaceae bacterium]